jgi:hypothetical protein
LGLERGRRIPAG